MIHLPLNRLAYLRITIDSILNQLSEIPFEIIIADGGSTDGTIKYLNKLATISGNIKVIEQGKLIGVAKAFYDCRNYLDNNIFTNLVRYNFFLSNRYGFISYS